MIVVPCMSRRSLPALAVTGLCLTAGLLGSGCYTAQLDPDLGGVFSCESDQDDGGDDEACPSGQACVNERCEDAEAVPALFVLNPEDEDSVIRDDVIDMLMMGQMPGAPLELTINIQGSLELVPASAEAEPVFGQGHVRVTIDGNDEGATTIDTGSIDGSTQVTVSVPPLAGPHRIVLQAFRNDGVAYDNPEATATRLFWLENTVARRPFVAIKSPWPGTRFGRDRETIDIELATNEPAFVFVDPASDRQAGRGHGHVHYGAMFPRCVEETECDEGYLGVVGASLEGSILLPESFEQDATLSVVLRHIDHTPYGIPFECDPTQPGPINPCMAVFETIEIRRGDE